MLQILIPYSCYPFPFPCPPGHWEGIYVLFQYAAEGKTAQSVQQLLANPDAESQGNLLRWATFAQ